MNPLNSIEFKNHTKNVKTEPETGKCAAPIAEFQFSASITNVSTGGYDGMYNSKISGDP